MSATISEIARRAGVSSATVSRVFSDAKYVSEKNRALVMKIAQELQYSPKQYQKRKETIPHNKIIGMIVPDIQNPYYTDIIHAIENITFVLGYDIFLCNTDEDTNKEIRSLSALRDKQIGGLIITPVSDAVEHNAEYLRTMNSSGIPVVLLDRDLKSGGLDGVFLNNYEGAYRATQAFIDCGHTHVATVCGPVTSKTGRERLNGYLGALRDNGIPAREENVLYGDFKMGSAYELIKKLLKTNRDVTAIFSANNAMTEGCLQAVFEQGMKIPNDIALISFGHFSMFRQGWRDISYVLQPTDLIAAECVKILLDKMNMGKKYKKIPSRRISFSSELVIKGSERCPAKEQNGA